MESVHLNLKKWKCELCDYASSRGSNFERHLKAIHQRNAEELIDDVNKEEEKVVGHPGIFRDKGINPEIELSMVNLFTRRENKEEDNFEKEESGLNDQSNRFKGANHLKCKECEFSSNDENAIKTHKWDVHPKIEEEKSDRESDIVTVSFGIIKDKKCLHCKFAASSAVDLMQHVRDVHFKMKDKVCPDCEFATRYAINLSRHVKAVHQKIKEKKCPMCKYAGNTGSNLKRHMKRMHHGWTGNIMLSSAEHVTKEKKVDETLVLISNAVPDIDDFSLTSHFDRQDGDYNESSTAGINDRFNIDESSECRPVELTNNASIGDIKIEENEAKIKNSFKVMCNQCDMLVGSQYIKSHIRRRHTKIDGKALLCKTCSFVSDTRHELKKHHDKVRHNGPPIVYRHQCQLCPAKFQKPTFLRMHLESAVHFNLKMWRCKYCDYSGNSSANLTSHVKKRHENEVQKRQSHINNEPVENEIFLDKGTDCKIDLTIEDKKFLLPLQNTAAKASITAPKCLEKKEHSLGQSLIVSENYMETSCIVTMNQKCPHCDHVASSTERMIIHKKVVHNKEGSVKISVDKTPRLHNQKSVSREQGEKLGKKTQKLRDKKCQHCKYATSRDCHLIDHVRTVHMKIKENKCDQCDYASYKGSHLTEHVKAVHLNIRDNKCDQCDYASYKGSHLTEHVKAVHLNIRDNKCDQCDYATSKSGSLKQHVKAVHDKIRDVKCPNCDFAASRKRTVRDHVNNVHKTQ
jgi:hypothetical protein